MYGANQFENFWLSAHENVWNDRGVQEYWINKIRCRY